MKGFLRNDTSGKKKLHNSCDYVAGLKESK